MKSFVIYLPSIQTSVGSAYDTQTSLLSAGIEAELFEGTLGNEAVVLFEKENRIVHNIDGITLNNGKVLYPGVKGCFHSHYRLWTKCVELNESIMIFEDDIVVSNKYKKIDFDEILILSINYDWAMAAQWKIYLEEKNKIDKAVNYSSRFMPGASGYIIKPQAAKKLIDYYSNTYLPADVAINSEICRLQIHPQLIGRSKTMAEKESMTRRKHW
jgi:GR25 family glycosyltransferase involved in LPS biosynthesis